MVVNTTKQVAGWRETTQFYNALQAATETLVKKGDQAAQPLFIDCLEDLTKVIPMECPKLLIRIWRSLGRHLRAIKARDSKYARRLLHRFHTVAVEKLGWAHELSIISHLMTQLDLGNLQQLLSFDDLMTKLLIKRSNKDCEMPAMAKHCSYSMNMGFEVSEQELEQLINAAGPYRSTWRDVEGKLSLVKVLHQGKLPDRAQQVLGELQRDKTVWRLISENQELSGGFHYYSGLLKKERRDLVGAFRDLEKAAADTEGALGMQHGLTKRRKLACEVAGHELDDLTAGI
jgi:hypothetical protein